MDSLKKKKSCFKGGISWLECCKVLALTILCLNQHLSYVGVLLNIPDMQTGASKSESENCMEPS